MGTTIRSFRNRLEKAKPGFPPLLKRRGRANSQDNNKKIIVFGKKVICFASGRASQLDAALYPWRAAALRFGGSFGERSLVFRSWARLSWDEARQGLKAPGLLGEGPGWLEIRFPGAGGHRPSPGFYHQAASRDRILPGNFPGCFPQM